MKIAKPSEGLAASDEVSSTQRSRLDSHVAAKPVIDPARLQFHLLRPARADAQRWPLLSEAYRCWSEVWLSTFYELEGKTQLTSDDFTRQDEIAAIFHDGECIATSSMRWVDLANPLYRQDSYFAAWSAEALDAAAGEGSRICIPSSFTVAAAWRRAPGFALNELLGALTVERFLLSDADTLVGTMRNDRGMNKLTYRLGFNAIQRDASHHGVPVDLVAFHRRSCKRPPFDLEVERKVSDLLANEVSHA